MCEIFDYTHLKYILDPLRNFEGFCTKHRINVQTVGLNKIVLSQEEKILIIKNERGTVEKVGSLKQDTKQEMEKLFKFSPKLCRIGASFQQAIEINNNA